MPLYSFGFKTLLATGSTSLRRMPMPVFTTSSQRGSLASAGLLCLTLGALLPSRAQAQFITNSPDPFQGSMLTLQAPTPTAYPPLGFGQTFSVTNIVETNNMIVG